MMGLVLDTRELTLSMHSEEIPRAFTTGRWSPTSRKASPNQYPTCQHQSQTSGLKNCEKILSLLGHAVCGILSWQPELIKTFSIQHPGVTYTLWSIYLTQGQLFENFEIFTLLNLMGVISTFLHLHQEVYILAKVIAFFGQATPVTAD